MVKKIVKRFVQKHRKKIQLLPRRTIAIMLSVFILTSTFFAGGLINSLAGNPTKVSGLNHSVPVQQINLMPTDADTIYYDKDNNITGYSRTTLYASDNGKESGKHSKIVVNEDGSVDFTATQNTWHGNNTAHTSTSYVENLTLIGQQINLAENPWLMTQWSGSGRVNGRIYISFTSNGTEYGKNGKPLTDNAAVKAFKNTYQKNPTAAKGIAQDLVDNGDLIMITLSNVIKDNDANHKYINPTETDFNAGSKFDFTVDLYKYLTEQIESGNIKLSYSYKDSNGNTVKVDKSTWLVGDEWKDSSKNYITVYMSSQIMASETGQQLTAGTNTHWEQFALGREVLDRPASMLPRTAEFMDITDVSEKNSVSYGRVSPSVDGSVTFSNTSDSNSVMFSWSLRRYFNVSELESLHVEATFSGMSADEFDIKSWYGGRVATTMDANQKYYTYRGTNTSLSELLGDKFIRSKETTDSSIVAVIDFNKFANNIADDNVKYTGDYAKFFPVDSLIYIYDVKLTLPAGAKITFTRLEFQVENQEIPATKKNTAYPWYSTSSPDSLPPVGTPTYSTALNGATGRSYNWAASPEDAPIVAQKVDLLSLKTFNFNTWSEEELRNADEETVDDSLYERYADGSSVYTNLSEKYRDAVGKDGKPKLTEEERLLAYGDGNNNLLDETNAYYTLMRYGTTTPSNWERNYYVYLDMDTIPYLYYSYEIMKEDENDPTEPQAGFYFHINNARVEKFSASSSQSKWAYQYYLDHSGIGLNECSSMYALGESSSFQYGTKAILSPTKARTGCIDISGLYVEGISDTIKNGEYLQFEALRIYLGANTKIKINYLFFGSKSLDESVKGQVIPTTAGDAYPWSVSKEVFDATTDPDSNSASYTYANKIDLISHVQDRENVNDYIVTGNINTSDGYPYDPYDNGKGKVSYDSSTGKLKVFVTDTSDLDEAYRFKAGYSFDHNLRLDIDTADLSKLDSSSVRYLNYSVEAPQGMRWAIMFSEPKDGTMRRAITTWVDSDAKWGDDENILTSAPAGKTYFRMATSGGYAGPNAASNADSEYDTYWQNKNNSSWRLYSIPGSQTGVIDLAQVTSDFSWKNGVVSIFFVAYRDPTFTGLQSYNSDKTVDAAVTFNYVYLTSSPIQKSNVGRGADEAGDVYNWGSKKVTAPSVTTKVNFLNGSRTDITKWDTTSFVDYFPNGIVDFIDKNNMTITETSNADKGAVSFNDNGTMTVNASAEYAFTMNFTNPIHFSASTLNIMQFKATSDVKYRIAMNVYDKNGKHQYIYLTKEYFSSIPSGGTDLAPAGTLNLALSFGKVLGDNGFDISSVYIPQISVRFYGSSSSTKLTVETLRTQALYSETVNNVTTNYNVDLSKTPYLYYSYRLIDKSTGKTVSMINNTYAKSVPDPKMLRVGFWFMKDNDVFYQRTLSGCDSAGVSGISGDPAGKNIGFGKPSFVRLDDDVTTGSNQKIKAYYGYGSESGCIDLRDYISDTKFVLNNFRFHLVNENYFDTTKYTFVVDYLFLGSKASSVDLSKYTEKIDYETTELADYLAPKPADFQTKITELTADEKYPTFAVSDSETYFAKDIQVDLSKTPYLFYSINYPHGVEGTFGLETDRTVQGSDIFYRDVSGKDGYMISAGASPSQYLKQSETGCIDVRQWYLDKEQKYSGDILNISNLIFFKPDTQEDYKAEVIYMYFGAPADKTIDLLPEYSTGLLDNGLPTRTWVNMGGSTNMEYDKNGNPIPASNPSSPAKPSTTVDFKGGDITGDGFNDLWYSSDSWSQIYLSYGSINNRGARKNGNKTDFEYRSTGNNQMSGLMIDLNETPYLHFSFDQPETSRTSFLLQLNDWSSTQSMLGKSAGEIKPWLSMYSPTSPSGQLINIVSNTYLIMHYKDEVMEENKDVMVSGNHGGVIDLRSWFTVTNGCNNVISLDSIRFYTHAANAKDGFTASDVKVNYLYLSSSSSAAFSVTFHKNYDDKDNDASNDTYTQYVLQNANEQYISDDAVSNFKVREDANGNSTHTFVGWYTDPECNNYFDIKGTPMTGNIDLYARWIDNSIIEKDDEAAGIDVTEVNLLTTMDVANKKTHTGSGTVTLDNEALSIENTATDGSDYVVEFPVNKAYSVNDLRSLFMGFDNNVTCEGFDIVLNAKSSTSRSYSLIQDAFYHTYLTDDKLLTAAPHDGESAFYTYLGVRKDLPVSENKDGLIEVNSVTFKIPAGVSTEIRYIKSGNEMALLGNSDIRAPQSTLKDQTFDLLKNTGKDPSFVITSTDIVYNELKSKSMTYGGVEYTQVAIHGREDGFAHIGGLYDYSIDMTIPAASNPGRWLQFSIDQSTDSYFTFALYAAFSGMVEGETVGVRNELVTDVHTEKSVSYFDSSLNGGRGGLVVKDLDSDSTTFIPAHSAYFNGSKTYWLDLYSWYKDALKPYRENSEVREVKLLGLRLFTDSRTTDTTINYMFIGSDESTDSTSFFDCWVEYPYRAGANVAKYYEKDANGNNVVRPNVVTDPFQMLGRYNKGSSFYISLDQLTNLKDDAPIDDPTKKFVGWVFRDYAVAQMKKQYMKDGMSESEADAKAKASKTDLELMPYLVYWNPSPTNGREYHPETNKGGSWSLSPVDGFVTDQKSIYYNFVTTDTCNTQIIVPLFAPADYRPTLKVTVDGGDNSAVSFVTNNVQPTRQVGEWDAEYGSEVVIRATGSNFAGWYDEHGVLLSLSKDYRVNLMADTELTAKFGSLSNDNLLEYLPQNGRTIVWLQSESGTAGSNFKLESVSDGDILLADDKTTVTVDRSNINDTTGKNQIACYWNIADGQMLKAIAPSGYHWEQLLSDGSTVRVSAENEYSFISSTNIKLVAKQGIGDFKTSVLIDEFAFDDDRTDPILRINGQVICAENEELVSCGLTFTDFKNHGEIPSIYCGASNTITATAWNSTTGQFVVEFSIEDSPEYVIRGYAIVRNTQTNEYFVRYSDCVASVF